MDHPYSSAKLNLKIAESRSGSGHADSSGLTRRNAAPGTRTPDPGPRRRLGVTLTELLATVAILGVIAAALAPRIGSRTEAAKTNACLLNRGDIELQCRLWRRATGSFPTPALSAIGADAAYFPEGIPTCPVDGSAYTIDTSTGRVVGHDH